MQMIINKRIKKRDYIQNEGGKINTTNANIYIYIYYVIVPKVRHKYILKMSVSYVMK
jgi:hypothetical protein